VADQFSIGGGFLGGVQVETGKAHGRGLRKTDDWLFCQSSRLPGSLGFYAAAYLRLARYPRPRVGRGLVN